MRFRGQILARSRKRFPLSPRVDGGPKPGARCELAPLEAAPAVGHGGCCPVPAEEDRMALRVLIYVMLLSGLAVRERFARAR
jgi:hypothetical protein